MKREVSDSLNCYREASTKAVDDYIITTKEGRENLDWFEKTMSELKDAVSWSKSYPFSSNELADWEKTIFQYLIQLDSAAQQTIHSLAEGLRQHSDLGSQELQKLRMHLIDSNLYAHEKFDIMIENVCVPLIKKIDRKIIEDPASFRMDWKDMLNKLKCRISSLLALLRDAAILWDELNDHQQSERDRTLCKLNNMTKNRGSSVEAKEQRILLVVQQSRQEISIRDLEKSLARVFRILDEIKVSYENTHKKEMAIIYEHTSVERQNLKTLVDRSKEKFFQVHKPREAQDENILTHTYSTKIWELCEETIKHTKLKETRLYEEIRTFLEEEIEKSILQSGQEWIFGQLAKLEREHDDIAESHKKRYAYIESQVYMVRAAEVKEHNKIMENRREITSKVLERMQKELKQTQNKVFEMFNNFNEHSRVLLKNGLCDTSIHSVKSTINQVEISYAECKNSLRTVIEDYQDLMQKEVEEMKTENVNLLTSMKLFSEGGNFAASEISKIRSEMKAVEIDFEKQGRQNVLTLKKSGKQCCSEAIKHVKSCINSLQSHLQDLIFSMDVTVLLQRAQNHVRKNVLALKYVGKLLRDQTSQLIDDGSTKWNKEKPSNMWRCTMRTVLELYQMLLGDECYKAENDQMKQPCTEGLVKHKNKTDVFLPVTFKILETSLQEIQQFIMGFYQGQKQCCVIDLLEPKVKNYMLEITSKYRVYQEQCICIWESELTDFFGTILKLRREYLKCVENEFDSIQNTFCISLKQEKSALKHHLENLRKSYQQNQIDTMAKLKPIQGFPGNQHILSMLCAEFQKKFGSMSEKVKDFIDEYMENTHQLQNKHNEDMEIQRALVKEILETLFGPKLSDYIFQDVQKMVKHLAKTPAKKLSLTNSNSISETMRFEDDSSLAWSTSHLLEVPKTMESISKTAEEFRKKYKQEEAEKGNIKPITLLANTIENYLQESHLFIKNESREVKHLYEQYKAMSEELSMKWRSTLESIDYSQTPRLVVNN